MSHDKPAGADETATLRPRARGPLILTGRFELFDVHGTRLATDRTQVKLCRCGASRTSPLCDGSHNRVAFRAENDPAEGI